MARAPRSWRDWGFLDWVVVAVLAVGSWLLRGRLPTAVSVAFVVAAVGFGLYRVSRAHREDRPGGGAG